MIRRKRLNTQLNIYGQIKFLINFLRGLRGIFFGFVITTILSFAIILVVLGIKLGTILIFIIITATIIVTSYFIKLKKIPNLYIGVPLEHGELVDGYILKDGWSIEIPGIFEHLLVYIAKVNLDFTTTIRTSDGVEVEIPIAIVLTVDKNSVLQYLEAGGVYGEGTKEKENEIGKGVSDSVIDFAMAGITTACRRKTLQNVLDMDPEIISETIRSIMQTDTTGKILKKPYKVQGFGVNISSFIIKKPKTIGEIAQLLDHQAIEELEKKYEITDLETKIEKTKITIEKLGDLIDPNAIYLILAKQGLVEEGYNTGLNMTLLSLAETLKRGNIMDIIPQLLKLNGEKK